MKNKNEENIIKSSLNDLSGCKELSLDWFLNLALFYKRLQLIAIVCHSMSHIIKTRNEKDTITLLKK